MSETIHQFVLPIAAELSDDLYVALEAGGPLPERTAPEQPLAHHLCRSV